MFTNKIHQAQVITKWLVISVISLFPFIQTTASELSDSQYSVSYGLVKAELSEQKRAVIVNKLNNMPDQLTGKASGKSRAELLTSPQLIANQVPRALSLQNKNNSNLSQDYTADFAIYGATSFLQDDYDGDGFYQTFSIAFDADIYSYNESEIGEVYALLYISKNGGPWTHYFTTDSFLIEGDTDIDEYEVVTTFLSGYSSDYYDVLIDLYQVGYDDVVASYSSDDSNALYALSIESADYDEPYVEVVEISAGSFYWLIIVLLSSGFIRLLTNRK